MTNADRQGYHRLGLKNKDNQKTTLFSIHFLFPILMHVLSHSFSTIFSPRNNFFPSAACFSILLHASDSSCNPNLLLFAAEIRLSFYEACFFIGSSNRYKGKHPFNERKKTMLTNLQRSGKDSFSLKTVIHLVLVSFLQNSSSGIFLTRELRVETSSNSSSLIAIGGSTCFANF